MLKTTLFSVFVVLFTVIFCLAAEIAGKWNGTLRTPEGDEFPISYLLKVDGDKLTGSVTIPDNELPINDGKIHGDSLSFTVNYQGNTYLNEGRVAGDSIKVRVHFGSEIIESILKRDITN